ncbi:MAG: AAA family ATPase, partial [Euryarchaeota archaeon]|nr:AAA family ATPase [Euryarchaeota archaeon]
MPVKFVNRERELNTLKMILERVRVGEGMTALVEGAAGIGKTALINQFINQAKDAEILRGKCDVNSKYRPYSLFTQALGAYGDLHAIRKVEESRKINDIAQELIVSPKMVFIDEVESGAGYLLYRSLTEHMKGVYFSPRMPEEKDGIWLTETKTSLPHVDPNNLDFSVIPRIYDFMESEKSGCIFIDNINYLIYLNGIERVVDFLHAIYNMSEGTHTIVISGRTEHLTEEEKNSLLSCFDDIFSLDIENERKEKRIRIIDWLNPAEKPPGVVFSSRRGVGKYHIGKAPLTAERIDFEIFEAIASEIKKGNDVVLDCIYYLIHYHGLRKVYLWLKSVIDYADKNNVNVYIVAKGLSERYIDVIRDLADEVPISSFTNYEDMKESGAMKFYDTIFNFLDYNSKKRVIILILEDLQWADRSSLELFRYITRNAMRSRIMIIATYRNEDVVNDDETASILEDIQNLENTHIIRLNNLRKEHVAELVRSIKPDADDRAIDLIYEKGEGNPLLTIAIVEHIGSDSFIIPESIRESVELMLDSLDERSLYFLRLIAVFGERIDIDTLSELYPNWKQAYEKVKENFVEMEGDSIVFKYAPYREIIYSDISKDTRIQMHLKIAELMEKRGNIVDAANHYYRARSQKALKYLKMAAEESIKDIALGDAIDYCLMALDIAQKYGMIEELIRIYETLGDRYVLSGDYRKAIEMYEHSLRLGHKRKVSIGIKIGNAYERLGEYEKALEILEKYEKAARGLERGKIHGAIGIIKWHIGDFKDSEKHLKEYLKYARRYKSVEDEAEAYRNLAIVQYYYTKYDEGLKYALKALD